MKFTGKLRNIIFATALPAMFVAAPVFAAGEGQIEGGNFYRIQNLTTGAAFANPASAGPCNVLLYRIRVHNPGPGVISSVNVRASFPSGTAISNTSTATISSQNASPTSVSTTATVNFSSPQNLTYQSGTTQLLDPNLQVIQSLPDGITSGGVNIGSVGVSLQQIRYVQFQEKVNCATPTPTPTPTPTNSPTPGPGPGPGPIPPTPGPLPSAGPATGFAAIIGGMIMMTSIYYYRRSRKAVVEQLRNK